MNPIIKLKRPTFMIIGTLIRDDGKLKDYSERLDHTIEKADSDKDVNTADGLSLDKSDIPAFDGQYDVRIIITTHSDYPRKFYPTTSTTGGATFVGKPTSVQDSRFSGPIVGDYAETYYSINGKDPKRTTSNLYTNFDLNNFEEIQSIISPSAISPSPSVIVESESLVDTFYNFNKLGFILKKNQSGSDVYHLKARTYYRGQKSDISELLFKVTSNITESTIIRN